MTSADFRCAPALLPVAVWSAARTNKFLRRISLYKTYDFHCASFRFANADERRRFREVWLTRLSTPVLYQVSDRSLAALMRMWLATDGVSRTRVVCRVCKLEGIFAGALSTGRHLPAVALIEYLINRAAVGTISTEGPSFL